MSSYDKLDPIRRIDEKLRKQLLETQTQAYADGVLPAKFKILVAMALDAIHQSPEGVRVLAQLALENGATWEEIAEILAVIHYNCGAIPLYTASEGLGPLLDSASKP